MVTAGDIMSEFDNEENILEKTLGNETIKYAVSSESVNSIIREFDGIEIPYAYVKNENSAFFVVRKIDSQKVKGILAQLRTASD